jgi:hypothetical protein
MVGLLTQIADSPGRVAESYLLVVPPTGHLCVSWRGIDGFSSSTRWDEESERIGVAAKSGVGGRVVC